MSRTLWPLMITLVVIMNTAILPTVTNADVPAITYTGKPVPPKLQACVAGAVQKLLLIDSSDTKTLRRFFYANIAADRMGERIVRRGWASQSDLWQKTALEEYFSWLLTKSNEQTAGVRDLTQTEIRPRLADNPEKGLRAGEYHIAFTLVFDNHKTMSASILINTQCKIFDLSPGIWISRLVDKSLIDSRIPAKNRKRK